MEGKVALITGGAQGLGRAFADRLLEAGAKVCIADVNRAVGLKAEEFLRKKYASDRVEFCLCDVTQPQQFEDTIKETIKTFGRLDILCNNAGIADEERWKRMIDINLNAVIVGTQLGLKYMARPQGHGGVIVNVASAAGVLPMPHGPVYAAVKHGVVGYSRSVGAVSKRANGVRVNCLCPTFTHTSLLDESLEAAATATEQKKLVGKVGIMNATEVADAFFGLVNNDVISGGVMLVTPSKRDILRMPRNPQESFKFNSRI